ncbi:MAG: SBBP repeat-containing protein, partial [Candidatus Hodarchaeota archaeon]
PDMDPEYIRDITLDSSNNIYSIEGEAMFVDTNYSIFKHNSSGDLVWHRNWSSGIGYLDYLFAISADKFDNIYVSGTALNISSLERTCFLLKYDDQGNVLWDNDWMVGEEYAYWAYFSDMKLDVEGNIYISGAVDELGVGRGIILIKFNSSGEYLWHQVWHAEEAWQWIINPSLAIDNLTNNIYVVATLFDDNRPDDHNKHDIIIGCYNSSGYYLWENTWDSSFHDFIDVAESDSNGNLYVGGRIEAVSSDALIVKFDNLGNEEWSHTWGTSPTISFYDDICNDLVIDSLDNLYAVGYTKGYNANQTDIFITKLNSSGNVKWASMWGTNASELAYAIEIDHLGYVYIAGSTNLYDINYGDKLLLKMPPYHDNIPPISHGTYISPDKGCPHEGTILTLQTWIFDLSGLLDAFLDIESPDENVINSTELSPTSETSYINGTPWKRYIYSFNCSGWALGNYFVDLKLKDINNNEVTINNCVSFALLESYLEPIIYGFNLYILIYIVGIITIFTIRKKVKKMKKIITRI